MPAKITLDNLDRATKKVAETETEGRPVPQAILFAMLSRGVIDLAKQCRGTVATVALLPLTAGVGAAIAMALSTLASRAFGIAARVLGASWSDAFLVVPGVLLLFAVYYCVLIKWGLGGTIWATYRRGAYFAIEFRRLQPALGCGGGSTDLLGFILGLAFGCQVAVVAHHSDHLGLGLGDASVGNCALLAVDNLLHGVLLDTCEIYDLHLTEKVRHGFWSGTVFYLCRALYDVCVLFIAINLYRSLGTTHIPALAARYARQPGVAELVAYLDACCDRQTRWQKSFPDEYTFFRLSSALLSADDKVAQTLATAFPHLDLLPEVRSLLVDSSGSPVFRRVR